MDGRNANGTQHGSVWSFSTDPAGEPGPRTAQVVQPEAHAEGVALDPVLAWLPGPGAQSQELWFAEGQQDLQLLAPSLGSSAASWALGSLQAGSSYHWRVDSIDALGRRTEGTLWSFTTSAAGLPAAAERPSPRHLASGLPTELVLAWSSGDGVSETRLYLGTDMDPPLHSVSGAGHRRVTGLQPATTYYWRVDQVGALGVRRGFTWRFRTHP